MSVAVTAALVVSASVPADAGLIPLPTPSSGLLPGLVPTAVPTLPPLLPTAPALPLPTLPPLLPTTPAIKPPAPPVTTPAPAAPAGPPAQAGGAPAAPPAPAQQAPQAGSAPLGVIAPGTPVTPDNAAALIAADPGADLYPQPPVDPATTPQAALVARLDEVQHREQYLQNVLIRTKADLALAQKQLGSTPPLVAMLTSGDGGTSGGTNGGTSGGSSGGTSGSAPVIRGSIGTPEGRVLALTSAVESGRAELARRQTEALELQRQANTFATQAVAAGAPAPAPATATSSASYVGGKLLRAVPGPVTSTFGNRFDPYYHVWQLHAGLDLGAPTGTPIRAAAPGRVTQAGWSGGYGNYTCIDHGVVGGQRLSTCYGHQSRLLVTPGQQVSAGQVIGLVGSTGAATGPHLHFEVRLGGRPVDPAPWLGR